MFPATAEERLNQAKLFVNRGAHRAEELLDEGTTHIKRHPLLSVTGAFFAGLSIGMVVGWTMRRK